MWAVAGRPRLRGASRRGARSPCWRFLARPFVPRFLHLFSHLTFFSVQKTQYVAADTRLALRVISAPGQFALRTPGGDRNSQDQAADIPRAALLNAAFTAAHAGAGAATVGPVTVVATTGGAVLGAWADGAMAVAAASAKVDAVAVAVAEAAAEAQAAAKTLGETPPAAMAHPTILANTHLEGVIHDWIAERAPTLLKAQEYGPAARQKFHDDVVAAVQPGFPLCGPVEMRVALLRAERAALRSMVEKAAKKPARHQPRPRGVAGLDPQAAASIVGKEGGVLCTARTLHAGGGMMPLRVEVGSPTDWTVDRSEDHARRIDTTDFLERALAAAAGPGALKRRALRVRADVLSHDCAGMALAVTGSSRCAAAAGVSLAPLLGASAALFGQHQLTDPNALERSISDGVLTLAVAPGSALAGMHFTAATAAGVSPKALALAISTLAKNAGK